MWRSIWQSNIINHRLWSNGWPGAFAWCTSYYVPQNPSKRYAFLRNINFEAIPILRRSQFQKISFIQNQVRENISKITPNYLNKLIISIPQYMVCGAISEAAHLWVNRALLAMNDFVWCERERLTYLWNIVSVIAKMDVILLDLLA